MKGLKMTMFLLPEPEEKPFRISRFTPPGPSPIEQRETSWLFFQPVVGAGHNPGAIIGRRAHPQTVQSGRRL